MHFIITVLKVVRVKVLLFLLVFAYFMTFLTRFEKKLWKKMSTFWPPPQKSMKYAKNNKNDSTFTLTTLKTDEIKCTPFFDFLPISWFFGGGQKIFWKNHASQDGQICNFCSGQARDMVLVTNTRFLGMGNQLEPLSEVSDWPEG